MAEAWLRRQQTSSAQRVRISTAMKCFPSLHNVVLASAEENLTFAEFEELFDQEEVRERERERDIRQEERDQQREREIRQEERAQQREEQKIRQEAALTFLGTVVLVVAPNVYYRLISELHNPKLSSHLAQLAGIPGVKWTEKGIIAALKAWLGHAGRQLKHASAEAPGHGLAQCKFCTAHVCDRAASP